MKKILLSMFTLLMLSVFAYSAIEFQPLSPEYVKWQQKQLNNKLGISSSWDEQFGDITEKNGIIPEPYNYDYPVLYLDDLRNKTIAEPDKYPDEDTVYGVYPDSYDARAEGRIPVPRSQSPWGTCWAHAITESAESSYITKTKVPNTSVKFSVLNLAWKAKKGLNYDYNSASEADKYDVLNTGGNASMGVTYFRYFYGPVADSECPYEEPFYVTNDQPKKLAYMHFGGSIAGSNAGITQEGRCKIKYYVLKYGGVYISYQSRNECYKNDAKTYFCPKSYDSKASGGEGHAVLIIGWDDSISDYAFELDKDAGEKEGAWLCMNSWGKNWMGDGTFYISYFDGSVQRRGSYYGFDLEPNAELFEDSFSTTVKSNSAVFPYLIPSTAEKTLNKYTAEEYGYITAIGNSITSGNMGTYRVTVGNKSASGRLGNYPVSNGFAVEPLMNGTNITKLRYAPGDEITVTVSNSLAPGVVQGSPYPTMLQEAPGIGAGKVFAKAKGDNEWTDIGALNYASSVLLYKAPYYVAKRIEIDDEGPINLVLHKNYLGMADGQKYYFKPYVLPLNASEPQINASSSSSRICKVEAGRVDGEFCLVPQGVGQTTINLTQIDGIKRTFRVIVKEPVESIEVTPETYTLVYGEEDSVQLTAKVLPSESLQDVKFSADNTSVKVDKTGLVKIVRPRSGKNIITVSSVALGKDLTPVSKKVVINVKVPVTGISINPTSKTIQLGESFKIDAQIHPSTATNTKIKWSSSKKSVVTVDENGKVNAVGIGSGTITAKSKDGSFTAKCKVTVVSKPTSIKVEDDFYLNVGSSHKLSYKILPDTVQEKYSEVLFSSSDKSIATVDSSGVVLGLKVGIVTITAKTKTGGFKDTCQVTVRDVVATSVTLNKNSTSMVVGSQTLLKATVKPSAAVDKTVIWSSSDTSIATVSKSGKVTAKKDGVVIITATLKNGKASDYCTVTVNKVPVEYVDVYEFTNSMKPGATYLFKAKAYPDDASFTKITWESSNTKVATVASDGTVEAISAGSCKITAKADGKSKSINLIVTSSIPVKSITLNASTVTLRSGSSFAIKATVKPDDATNKKVTYSSSNSSVAKVTSAGLVKAIKTGKCYITVTSVDNPKVTATLSVTVR